MQNKLNKKSLAVIVSGLLVFLLGLVFLKTPNTEDIRQDYEDITQPVDTEQNNTDGETATTDNNQVDTSAGIPDAKTGTTEPELNISEDVVITSALVSGNTLTIRGYVDGVIEDGGTCAFSLVDAGNNVVASVIKSGLANVTTTSCGSADLDITGLNGSYRVRLTYSSDSTAAISRESNIAL